MESNTLHRGRLIDHILLVVEDFEASKNFYTAVLSALEIPVITTANEYLLADELVLASRHSPEAAPQLIYKPNIRKAGTAAPAKRLGGTSKGGTTQLMETEVKTRRKIQLRMPGRRTATGKNVNWILMKRNKVLYLFILPAFLYFLIFAYVPMYGVQIAFKDFVANKGFLGSEWADPLFKHFITFFSSVNFWEILRNTIGLSLYYLAISFPMPILLALMINEVKNTRFKKAVQNITYMPYFVSTVVLVGMINLFFSYNGLANNIGALFGAEPQMFLMKDALFNDLYVWSGVWQATGYGAVIYIAALAGVSPDLHEAATIDGATRLQRIIHINLPAIMPTIVIMLIMAVGGIMNLSFEKVLLMQTDSNTAVSEVISTYVYKLGIQRAQYSLSAAVGLFNNIINLILLVTVNKVSRKISETSVVRRRLQWLLKRQEATRYSISSTISCLHACS